VSARVRSWRVALPAALRMPLRDARGGWRRAHAPRLSAVRPVSKRSDPER